jgi:hypothetical protein
MGCVDINDKCVSFLVSPKNLDIRMTCATSTLVMTFLQFYFMYRNNYIKNEQRIKLKNESGFFKL